MLDKFKARLKAKTKAAGVNLSQKRIDAFAARLHKKNPDVTEDADHDTAIDELDELVDFKEVAKEDDRVRTLEAKAKPKPAEEDQDDDDEDQEGSDQKPKKKSAKKSENDDLRELVKSLSESVNSLVSEKKTSSIREKLAAKLKDKKIPEKFYNKRTLPEKEEDLDDFITEIETDWTELAQENNNLVLGSQSTPVNGVPGGKSANIDKDIETWASTGKKSEETSK